MYLSADRAQGKLAMDNTGRLSGACSGVFPDLLPWIWHVLAAGAAKGAGNGADRPSSGAPPKCHVTARLLIEPGSYQPRHQHTSPSLSRQPCIHPHDLNNIITACSPFCRCFIWIDVCGCAYRGQHARPLDLDHVRPRHSEPRPRRAAWHRSPPPYQSESDDGLLPV